MFHVTQYATPKGYPPVTSVPRKALFEDFKMEESFDVERDADINTRSQHSARAFNQHPTLTWSEDV